MSFFAEHGNGLRNAKSPKIEKIAEKLASLGTNLQFCRGAMPILGQALIHLPPLKHFWEFKRGFLDPKHFSGVKSAFKHFWGVSGAF